MFDYTVIHWLTFLSAAVLLNLSPGPDIAFILGQTLHKGHRQGFAAMFGTWTGGALHIVMAAVGLSAILAASTLVFSIIKWLGAVYLIWLGGKILFLQDNSFSPSKMSKNKKNYPVYWQGVLISALNPKTAIFFLTFLPQFVVEGAGSSGAQLFLHGCLMILIAGFIDPVLIMLGARLGALLKKKRQVMLWVNRGLGGLFITIGVRLASSTK